jgi:hypothetical protein
MIRSEQSGDQCSSLVAREPPPILRSMAEAYFAGALALWLLLTILCQLPGRPGEAIRKLDLLSLIPRWRLFAPHPLCHDYALLYRTGHPPKTLGPWTPTQLEMQGSAFFTPLINPARRNTKIFLDVAQELLTEASGPRRKATSDSRAYRYLLSVVANTTTARSDEMVQFAILRISAMPRGAAKVHMVFVSRWHRLSNAAPVPP